MKHKSISQLDPTERTAIQVLVNRLSQVFSDQVVTTHLFGSKARGDDSAESDIDILVITASENWRIVRKIRQIGARVSLEHDVLFNMHVVDCTRWAEMERTQSTYWRTIQRDGIELLSQAA
jgi:predicted nucleotidyltransferase